MHWPAQLERLVVEATKKKGEVHKEEGGLWPRHVMGWGRRMPRWGNTKYTPGELHTHNNKKEDVSVRKTCSQKPFLALSFNGTGKYTPKGPIQKNDKMNTKYTIKQEKAM